MRGNKKTNIRRPVFGAAAGFFAVALLFTGPAWADVRVKGLPEWLTATVAGPVDAVWQEVSRRHDAASRERMLELVVKRLFPGIRVEGIEIPGEDLVLSVAFAERGSTWDVALIYPALGPDLISLFASDLGDASDVLSEMLRPLPVDCIGWAGQPFLQRAEGILSERLPGWSPSFIFRQSKDGSMGLEASFHPLPPVVVAYSPRIRSGSLPRLLQAEISDGALEVLSSYVGLPTPWVKRHSMAIERLAALSLESRWAARDIRGKVDVSITPDRVAPVDVRVESDRYTLKGWVAASLGSEERHPELGIFLGRRIDLPGGRGPEIFTELIAVTNDFSLESRWGLRFQVWEDIRLGAEWVLPENRAWYRVWADEILPGIYLWGRFNAEGDSNAALGWRFGEYLSGELYYDSRDGDGLRVRVIGEL